MNILILCSYGKNRSRFLASYLYEQGYQQVDYDGVKHADPSIVQKKIDLADIIITVHPDVASALHEQFKIADQQVIELNVDDRPEIILPGQKDLDGKTWLSLQQGLVYPKLMEGLEKHLPLKKRGQ